MLLKRTAALFRTQAPSPASASPPQTSRPTRTRRTSHSRRSLQIEKHRPSHAAEFAQLKPQIAVRDLAGFKREFLLWAGAILAAFLLTNLIWTIRGFTGPLRLPTNPLQCLRASASRSWSPCATPFATHLIFVPFAQGVAGGCILMLLGELRQLGIHHRKLQLRAAAGRHRPFPRADLLRFWPQRQRRAGEPGPLPTR